MIRETSERESLFCREKHNRGQKSGSNRVRLAKAANALRDYCQKFATRTSLKGEQPLARANYVGLYAQFSQRHFPPPIS